MALVDTLDIAPPDSRLSKTLLHILRYLGPRTIASADESGAWWLVITQPGREGNYFESSGTAMFIYAIFKGIRKGYLEDLNGKLLEGARKGYQYMVDNWVTANGTLMDWQNTVEARLFSLLRSHTNNFGYRLEVYRRRVITRYVFLCLIANNILMTRQRLTLQHRLT